MMIFLHAVRTEKGHTEFQQPINSISGLSSCYESPQQTKNKGHETNRQSLEGWLLLPRGSLKQPASLLESISIGRVTDRNSKLTEYFITSLEYFI